MNGVQPYNNLFHKYRITFIGESNLPNVAVLLLPPDKLFQILQIAQNAKIYISFGIIRKYAGETTRHRDPRSFPERSQERNISRSKGTRVDSQFPIESRRSTNVVTSLYIRNTADFRPRARIARENNTHPPRRISVPGSRIPVGPPPAEFALRIHS